MVKMKSALTIYILIVYTFLSFAFLGQLYLRFGASPIIGKSIVSFTVDKNSNMKSVFKHNAPVYLYSMWEKYRENCVTDKLDRYLVSDTDRVFQLKPAIPRQDKIGMYSATFTLFGKNSGIPPGSYTLKRTMVSYCNYFGRQIVTHFVDVPFIITDER